MLLNTPQPTLRALLAEGGIKNVDLPCELLNYLILGQATCGVTGRAGSGRYTVSSCLLGFVDPMITLRVMEPPKVVIELMKELPYHNILTVTEVSLHKQRELQDVHVHRDKSVLVVAEVCTDELAYGMVREQLVSYTNTIFIHHANTTKDLVFSLRNSVCHAANMDNMSLAEKLVLEFLDFDIHVVRTASGMRYIERITEVIPVVEEPKEAPKNLLDDYTQRTKSRESFEARDIVVYNADTQAYVALHPLSDVMVARLSDKMRVEKAHMFKQFLETNFIR